MSVIGHGNQGLLHALSGLKKSEVGHEANARRPRKSPPCHNRKKKAERLAAGAAKESHLKKARDHESSARSSDWRNSTLKAPK